MFRHCALAALALAHLTPLAQAQWAHDPAVNTVITDLVGNQAQPKVVVRPSSLIDPAGGYYVSWLELKSTGSEIWAQSLTTTGIARGAPGGFLVASLYHTVGWSHDMCVDSSGCAVLVFRESSGPVSQNSAARISPFGVVLNGPVQVSATPPFVGSSPPFVACTTDWNSAVLWGEGGSLMLQWLDWDLTPLGGAVTVTSTTGTLIPYDVISAGTDVIVCYGRPDSTGTYADIVAQKYDASGAPQWGAAPVVLFDGASYGQTTQVLPDGSGGAVLAWYGSSTPLRAQRLTADGIEVFPHNGTLVTQAFGIDPRGPGVTYDPDAEEVYVAWSVAGTGLWDTGVLAQKLDSVGNAAWAGSGLVVQPVGPFLGREPRCVFNGTEAMIAWKSTSPLGNEILAGATVSSAGTITAGPFPVSSAPANKTMPYMVAGHAGSVVLAWRDDRTDPLADIYAQGVNADGSLGMNPNPPIFCLGDGVTGICPCGNLSAIGSGEGCANSSGSGALLTASGTPSVSADTLTLTVHQAAPSEFGIFVQNTGLVAYPPVFYDGRICLRVDATLVRHYLPPVVLPTRVDGAGSGTNQSALSLPVFPGLVVPGMRVYYQYWYRDPAGSCGSGANFSSGIFLDWLP